MTFYASTGDVSKPTYVLPEPGENFARLHSPSSLDTQLVVGIVLSTLPTPITVLSEQRLKHRNSGVYL